MRIFLPFIVASIVMLATGGCSLGPDAVGALSTGGLAPTQAAPEPMRLQSGDKIRVTVFGEEELSGEFEIDPSGYVSLPLAGTLPAAGLTKLELEQTVAEKLKSNYIRDPKVTVDVASFRPIYVLGEVQKPGAYTYQSGLNVVSALAVAGGATYRASKSRVLIQRSGETALKEHVLDPSVPIMPGDVIRVPERYF